MQTDHRPLEAIFRKPLGNASPQLQRILLRLQKYDVDVKFFPGKYMYVADTPSRSYIPVKPERSELEEDAEVMIHSLVRDLPLRTMRKEQIRAAAAVDPDLQKVRQAVMIGWSNKKHSAPNIIQDFWQVKDDVHVAEGLLFIGDGIVDPKSLQAEILALLHDTHMRAVKMKSRATSALFWPGMPADLEKTMANCLICL